MVAPGVRAMVGRRQSESIEKVVLVSLRFTPKLVYGGLIEIEVWRQKFASLVADTALYIHLYTSISRLPIYSCHAAYNFSEYLIRRFFEPTNRRSTKPPSGCHLAATVQFIPGYLLIHTWFDIPSIWLADLSSRPISSEQVWGILICIFRGLSVP